MKLKTVVSAVKGIIKPRRYDEGTILSNCKRQYGAAADSNEWSDQKKAIAIILALRHKALGILHKYTRRQTKRLCYNGERWKYDIAVILGNIYRPINVNSEVKVIQPLQEYGSDIERLIKKLCVLKHSKSIFVKLAYIVLSLK